MDDASRIGEEVKLLVKDTLGPLERHYLREDVSEIVVNAPGVCFHKLRKPDRLERVWRAAHDPDLTHGYLMLALRTFANMQGLEFDGRTHQTLHGTLPGGHRLAAVAGSGVMYDEERPEGGVALAIRQTSKGGRQHELTDWGVAEKGEWESDRIRERLREWTTRSDSVHDRLFDAARTGHAVMLSGPTDTGKTSLLNRLLQEIDDDVRVITVEDTPELNVPVANRVHLLMQRSQTEGAALRLSPKMVRNVVTRFNPDAILIGEISPDNAALAIELLRLGHSHCWTSIHAGSPEEAAGELAQLARVGNAERDVKEIEWIIRTNFIIIQTGVHRGQRIIDTIQYPETAEPEEEKADVPAGTQERKASEGAAAPARLH